MSNDSSKTSSTFNFGSALMQFASNPSESLQDGVNVSKLFKKMNMIPVFLIKKKVESFLVDVPESLSIKLRTALATNIFLGDAIKCYTESLTDSEKLDIINLAQEMVSNPISSFIDDRDKEEEEVSSLHKFSNL